MKSNKAITLVALVITIVVLIILAAVAINMTLGDNGIFQRAKTATRQMGIESAKEKLEIEKGAASVRTKGQKVTLADYIETVREDNVADNILDRQDMGYAEIAVDGYVFKVEEADDGIKITYIGTEEEVATQSLSAEGVLTITLSKTEWTNENITATATGSKEGYTVQMSLNGTTWTETNTLTVEENSTVYACLYNGIRYGAAVTETVSNIDKQKPAAPTITNPSNGQETEDDVVVTVASSDDSSGIAKYQAYYNGEWHDRDETSNTLTDTWNIDIDGTVKYRVVDKAGNISDEMATTLKISKINATISNMTNGDLEISATVALTGNIDYENVKYVFTTNNNELGTNDATLYSDGTISSANSTVKATKKSGTYYLHILAASNSGYKRELISTSTATSQGKKDFDYTGTVQNITLTPGNYKLEVWGAQGAHGNYSSGNAVGGKGGYSYGTISLNSTTNLYVYAGGQGLAAPDHSNANGGFNGGGYANTNSSTSGSSYLTVGPGGGGGSDIRIGTDSLYARVIVAGGGGGSFDFGSNLMSGNGYGGGTNGGTGTYYSSYGPGYGGSQISGGSSTTSSNMSTARAAGFGVGASPYSSSVSGGWQGGAGGGGWYGGGHGGAISSGGGGSGWIFTESTYNAWRNGNSSDANQYLLKDHPEYYLTDAQTIAGNTQFDTPGEGKETGHEGNGYARITVVD